MNIGTHVFGIQFVGIIVEIVFISISVICIGAVYPVGHIFLLLRSYLGRIIFRSTLERLSPEEEVVHILLVEQRTVCACKGSWLFCGCFGIDSTSLIYLVGLVMTGFGMTIVWLVAVLTFTQIGNTRIIARDFICSMSVLIVAVGIIVVYILQCLLLSISTIFLFCYQIVSVEIVSNLTILKVIVCIALFGLFAIPTIYDRSIRG